MADGVFTPAVSVTSAVGGIGVAKPDVIKDIIPISVVSRILGSAKLGLTRIVFQVFLLALFFVQQFGTQRLAFVFAPSKQCFQLTLMCVELVSVSFLWFLLLIGTGIYNITFFPGVFRAFDPSRAVLRKSSPVYQPLIMP